MRTPLTEPLEVDHAVMFARTGGEPCGELASAAPEAGGFGTLRATTIGAADAQLTRLARR